MRAQTLILSATLLLALNAKSQGIADFKAVEARLKSCNDAHPDIPGSSSCELAAFVAADKQLNQTYAGVMTVLKHPGKDHADYDPEVVQRLVASERAWVAFRDAECHYQSTLALHAPLEGYEYSACRFELTKARIKSLTSPDAPQNQR